jgi:hypothetical protein
MGRQIAKQPNGLYAVWSSIADDFIVEDATEEEIRNWWIKDAIEDATERANRSLNDSFMRIEKNGTDNWGDDYKYLSEIRDEVHGEHNNCDACDLDYPICNNCLGA